MIAKYLDLSTGHLTDPEVQAVGANAPGLPYGIGHEYGAWLNMPQDTWDERDWDGVAKQYPNIVAVLRYARTLDKDVNWINFDGDGEKIDTLPFFNW